MTISPEDFLLNGICLRIRDNTLSLRKLTALSYDLGNCTTNGILGKAMILFLKINDGTMSIFILCRHNASPIHFVTYPKRIATTLQLPRFVI